MSDGDISRLKNHSYYKPWFCIADVDQSQQIEDCPVYPMCTRQDHLYHAAT